jgi:hypothetical protein
MQKKQQTASFELESVHAHTLLFFHCGDACICLQFDLFHLEFGFLFEHTSIKGGFNAFVISVEVDVLIGYLHRFARDPILGLLFEFL